VTFSTRYGVANRQVNNRFVYCAVNTPEK
jgi:hypothetical protein